MKTNENVYFYLLLENTKYTEMLEEFKDCFSKNTRFNIHSRMKTKDAKCCTGVALPFEHPTGEGCWVQVLQQLQTFNHNSSLYIRASCLHQWVWGSKKDSSQLCHVAERGNRLTWTAALEFSYVKIYTFSRVLCFFYFGLFVLQNRIQGFQQYSS